jgi:mRNA-degrading endonuclease RelE of RelBE toxin-antitoxin system
MSFSLKITLRFDKELKRLSKKYPSLKTEFIALLNLLEEEPFQGKPIGNGFYKIRLGISSKGKGKRGGARIITYVAIIDEVVYLTTIYDKSEKETISQKELDLILSGLQ